MAVKLDETDAGILKALMEDGRRSLREIARIVSVSTPTVENRLKRLFDMGVVRKISPIIDPDKFDQGIYALINLRVDPSRIDEVSSRLTDMEEVRCIFMVTGENNLTIRIVLDSIKSFQDFLTTKISTLPSVQLVSSNVITKTVKEEQSVIIRPSLGVHLRCDYCNGKIEGEPSRLRVGERDRYFCCGTCLEAYKEKYGSKIESLSRQEQQKK